MARPLRIQFPGAIYHVMVRGNERRCIFKGDRDRRRLLDQLAQAMELYGVRLYLACLMPNHVHLLLETPRSNRPEDVALRRAVPGLNNSKRVLAEVAAVLGV